jgi:steroid delta-isomerase-like uncharacterized protein
MEDAITLIKRYYSAFNEGDADAMIACLAPDVAHHVNEGQVRRGTVAFRAFCDHMARCYAERLEDVVIMATPDGTRAAAEFTVRGTYLATDGDLPAAHGQSYVLPAGGFFSVRDGQISRIVTYYNLADWVAQVSK